MKQHRAASDSDYESRREDDVTPTLNAMDNTSDTFATVTITDPRYRVRRLTPTECERLQAWPDDHTRHGIDDNGNTYELSDSQRYKQIGNGVTSTVAHYIAALIIHAHEETTP